MKHIVTTIMRWFELWWFGFKRDHSVGWTFRYAIECFKLLPMVISAGIRGPR